MRPDMGRRWLQSRAIPSTIPLPMRIQSGVRPVNEREGEVYEQAINFTYNFVAQYPAPLFLRSQKSGSAEHFCLGGKTNGGKTEGVYRGVETALWGLQD